MEKGTKKTVVLPGLTVCFGNQSLCVLGSVIQARMVIQINGKAEAEIPPELMQAIVKAIEGES